MVCWLADAFIGGNVVMGFGDFLFGLVLFGFTDKCPTSIFSKSLNVFEQVSYILFLSSVFLSLLGVNTFFRVFPHRFFHTNN